MASACFSAWRRGDGDIAGRRIDARYATAQPGHRLAQQPAAAADVEQRQALQRRARTADRAASGRRHGRGCSRSAAGSAGAAARTCRSGSTTPRRCAKSARSRPDRRCYAQFRPWLPLTPMVLTVSIPRFRAGPWRASFSNLAALRSATPTASRMWRARSRPRSHVATRSRSSCRPCPAPPTSS